MDDKNILTEGIETLYTIKENLLELSGYLEKSKSLTEEEKLLEVEISVKEKQMTDEIAAVVKKRKDEVAVSFDEQLDKIKARVKKVKAKKEKLKDAKVSERIKAETSEYEEERILHIEEIRELFKVNKIPRIFNTGLYYILFMPHSIKDVLFILLALLVILFGIPLGVYNYFLPQETMWLVLAYVITFLLIGGLYIIINHLTKEKHREAFILIRAIRKKLYAAEKNIRNLKKSIWKDRDESQYGLEKFDDELEELDKELASVAGDKKNALVAFESVTKHAISEGIKANYEKDLNLLHEKHDAIYEEQRKADTKAKEFAVEISKRYEGFIGKENLNPAGIDELIQRMETGGANTIAEAISSKQ